MTVTGKLLSLSVCYNKIKIFLPFATILLKIDISIFHLLLMSLHWRNHLTNYGINLVETKVFKYHLHVVVFRWIVYY